jgi:2-hydroxy-3-oxopropionate reductase
LRALFDEIVDAGLGDRDISVTRRLTAQRHPTPPRRADYAET